MKLMKLKKILSKRRVLNAFFSTSSIADFTVTAKLSTLQNRSELCVDTTKNTELDKLTQLEKCFCDVIIMKELTSNRLRKLSTAIFVDDAICTSLPSNPSGDIRSKVTKEKRTEF